MMRRRFAFKYAATLIIGAAMFEAPAGAQGSTTANAPASPNTQCTALESVNFTLTEDAPTQIVEAKSIEAQGKDPAYCRVRGYVSPHVSFELQLPLTNWNGKFVEIGCGGSCGTTMWTFWCPIRKGYACIAADMGHQGKDQDMVWAYNDLQAQLDFDTRGPHVAGVAGKAIAAYYYGKASERSYFMGCSNGGAQALAVSQRFPWDFDGIIALAGVPSYSDMNAAYLWGVRALQDEKGKPVVSRHELQLMHNAALARCDLDDGVKDGIIGDPFHCAFDPAELICKAGSTGECLSKAQVEAVKKVYQGPTNSNGQKLSYIRGFAPGSEMGWVDDPGLDSVRSDGKPGGLEQWSQEVFRYMEFMPSPGPKWQLSDFDFDHDYARMGVSETLWGASNPDLRKFKAAGGKFIDVQGGNDQNVFPSANIDYYEMVERTMGGRKQTQDFFRLFFVPGMTHCSGGDGAFAIDYLKYLEAWVEQGQAPDMMMGAHVPGLNVFQGLQLKFPLDSATPVSFSRPVYPYPLRAKYKGKGSPKDAANFTSVEGATGIR